MDNILITAFDPFGTDETNSSEIVLNLLPQMVDGVIINKMVVPTVYKDCADLAYERAVQSDSFAVIALGQAGRSESIRIETVGINYALAELRDNKGSVLYGERLFENGENAYFSNLPVKMMAESISKIGFASTLSCSAGGFVCNSMLYTLLKKIHENNKSIMCGFIHLPYADIQGKDCFSMKGEDMAQCVTEAIKTVIKYNCERKH